MRYKYLSAIFVLFITITLYQEDKASTEDIGYIDTHTHLNGRYRTGRGVFLMDYEGAARNLINKMDKLGIEKTIIMPPPQKPGQKVSYDYRTLIGAVEAFPTRLVFGGGGGILNPMIQGYPPLQATASIKTEFRRKAEEIARSGAKCFGEMTALHLSFRDDHVFEEVSPDHPLFLLLADIASENNIPIDIHMEAVKQDMPMPQKLSMISKNNPPILKENINAFRNLLDHNKNTKIVWQHIGWDNTGHMTVQLLRTLLENHNNLYLSIRLATIPPEIPEHLIPQTRIVDKNWKIKPEWLKLMYDFPERFMVGADEFIGVSPVRRHKSQSFEETWQVIDKELPEDLRRKIGHHNAARVYNLK